MTVWGRKVLKARRRKWRWSLTPTVAKRYQTVKGKSKMHIIARGNARVVRMDWVTYRAK